MSAHGHSAEFAGPTASPHYPPDLELDPVDLSIAVREHLEERALDVTVEHVLVARRDGAAKIALDGVGFVALVVEDPGGDALDWTYDGLVLHVEWRQGAPAGDVRRLRASYRVERPAGGAYFSGPTRDQPDLARFVATDHETERARHWLLCVDHPAATPRLSFALRTRDSFTALANGAFVDRVSHGDGTSTTRWRLDAPCPSYLVCFAVGEFTECDDGEHVQRLADGSERRIPLRYFAPSSADPARLRRIFGRTGAMLAWMEGLLGVPYPYPKYFQIVLPDIGGAMENISLVTWDGQFLLEDERLAEWSWLVDLVNVHEMAHSWFGDHVTCRDFADSWLKESWATYVEAVWRSDWFGRDEGDWIAWDQARAYFNEARDGYQRPIVTRHFESSWQLFDRHLYPGGARRLHTLACELGHDVFWRGVREYLARHGGSGVETDDFRRVLEEVSGRSLARFFDQWLRTAGHPRLVVRFRREADRAQGVFEISQEQVDPKVGGNAFTFHLVLAWRIDGSWHERRIHVTRERQQVHVPMATEPDLVRVDPRGEVLVELDFDPGEDRLLRQLAESEDARGRYQAAWQLANAPSDRRARAILAAAEREPFWAARVEYAMALARMASPVSVGAVVECARRERDPLALEGVLRAAGSIRDPAVAEVLGERLGRGLPPRARAAAIEGLGSQREDAPLDVLVDESRRVGESPTAQSAALRALGATRMSGALGPLIDALRPDFRAAGARPSAATGLGELARVLDPGPKERAVDALIAALRDPDRLVALAAARALGRAGEARAATRLESFAAGLPVQERVAIRRVAAGLVKKEAAAVPEREVERLRATLRQLESRIANLEARADGTRGPA